MDRQWDNEIDALYRAHAHELFSYAMSLCLDREVAMDAVHDVFCNICENSRLRPEVDNMRFYLIRAVKNRLIDMAKSNRSIPLSMETVANEFSFGVRASVEDAIIEIEEREKLRRRVEQLLSMLTDRQREIIYLRYEQELDYEEISKVMHITASSCRKLVHKAIDKLRKHVGAWLP
jgi:RNA polymerase sigma factor (sigma-70 family)